MNPKWFKWAESAISQGSYLVVMSILAIDLIIRLITFVLMKR